jgi:DNA-binding HxlR family transcriptional regulator
MVDPAELFEAISHPARIRILKALEKNPSSFASLKRQLNIDSSGNLDYHLKKLGDLVTVRQDGLYGLTDVGKKALLSIDAVEMWKEAKRRKIKISSEIPKEAYFMGLLELVTTVSILWFFFAVEQLNSPWGYFLSGVVLLLGAYSTLGILTQQEWSWRAVLVKSALVMLMSLFLLNYLLQPGKIAQLDSWAVTYGVFVAAEAIAIAVVLRHSLKDFLGIKSAVRLSLTTIVAGLLGITSGILLIILESMQPLKADVSTVFNSSIGDTTILCGLAIGVGGVLILTKAYALGALISIVFGLYPPPQYGSHVYDLIYSNMHAANEPIAILIAVAYGSLPLIGGILALLSVRKIL